MSLEQTEQHCTDISRTFRRHHSYYASIGAETIHQQMANENSLQLSYAGRTLFELVQNALDRCQEHVWVALLEDPSPRLIVGNDGHPVSVGPNFNYESWVQDAAGPHRSDFHALCSVHTSNKHPDESIGNKGVGFRSVFSLGDQVQVWSRLRGSHEAWWGLEMHRKPTRALLERRLIEDPSVQAGRERFLGGEPLEVLKKEYKGPWPSFYVPLPLFSAVSPLAEADTSRLQTLILVPLGSQKAKAAAEQGIQELRASHFHFVGLRDHLRSVSVRTVTQGTSINQPLELQEEDSPQVSFIASCRPDAGNAPDVAPQLAQLALKAEHAVSSPGVAVAWPSVVGSDHTTQSRLFCYLPTAVKTPFSIDIHADFQLGTDRTTLKVGTSDVGQYNQTLLRMAAELHLMMALRHASFNDEEIRGFTKWEFAQQLALCHMRGQVELGREDLFALLTPPSPPHTEVSGVVVSHMQWLLFQGKPQKTVHRYERWAQIAQKFFAQRPVRTRRAFQAFWRACGSWLDQHKYGRHTRSWGDAAQSLCDALRQKDARTVPLLEHAEGADNEQVEKFLQLPDRREQSDGRGRAERRIFVTVHGIRRRGQGPERRTQAGGEDWVGH